MTYLKVGIIEKFEGQVPASTKGFIVGYLEGPKSKEHWIFNDADLGTMYKMCKDSKEIPLWCEPEDQELQKATDDPFRN